MRVLLPQQGEGQVRDEWMGGSALPFPANAPMPTIAKVKPAASQVKSNQVKPPAAVAPPCNAPCASHSAPACAAWASCLRREACRGRVGGGVRVERHGWRGRGGGTDGQALLFRWLGSYCAGLVPA